MRALLFSIAVLTITPAFAEPPSDFWFEQMEQETGTPDIGGAPVEDYELGVDGDGQRLAKWACDAPDACPDDTYKGVPIIHGQIDPSMFTETDDWDNSNTGYAFYDDDGNYYNLVGDGIAIDPWDTNDDGWVTTREMAVGSYGADVVAANPDAFDFSDDRP